MRDVRNKQSGFTLLELMIVVAIIGLIAAVAIPTALNSRKNANEAAAIGGLRNMSYAQEQYRQRAGSYGTVNLLSSQGFLDDSFVAGNRLGYDYTDNLAPTAAVWAMEAQPSSPGATGDRFFFVDSSGVIRFEDGAAAGNVSSPVE